MALGLHFRLQSAHAIALTMIGKRFAHLDLSSRLNGCILMTALPSVVRAGRNLQHVAELTHGHLGLV
jgi:hypothetical protein